MKYIFILLIIVFAGALVYLLYALIDAKIQSYNTQADMLDVLTDIKDNKKEE